jgi:hypothetical protein
VAQEYRAPQRRSSSLGTARGQAPIELQALSSLSIENRYNNQIRIGETNK